MMGHEMGKTVAAGLLFVEKSHRRPARVPTTTTGSACSVLQPIPRSLCWTTLLASACPALYLGTSPKEAYIEYSSQYLERAARGLYGQEKHH
eukprot:5494154-Pyramimonas_sp.AAC.1